MAGRKSPKLKQAPRQAQPETPEEWTVRGFLDEFMQIHDQMQDRSFLFILGAGASVSSEIPTGKAMARGWVEELWHQAVGDAGTPLDEWATPGNLRIPEFSLHRVDEFYPQVYGIRFRDDRERGQAYLEEKMAGAKPGVGYSILAQILAKTRHKAVITTNFDNLVADALAAYTDTFPLVCGHESLADFVRARLRRPVVAKIHRDLLLAPQSAPDETGKLPEEWTRALVRLLADFTPIVVGYGGNDGSLMSFLEDLEPGTLRGGIYWCYWSPGGAPNQRIRTFVARQHGRFVAISDFDEFMLQVNDRFEWAPLTAEMQEKQGKELERYKRAFEELSQKIHRAGPEGEMVRQALEETVEREKSPWQWLLKALAESDPVKRDAVYQEGLAQSPNNPQLAASYARFIWLQVKDADQAGGLYKKALALAPNNIDTITAYAVFLHFTGQDPDQAERLFERALEIDPGSVSTLGAYGAFLADTRKDEVRAERFINKALELQPDNTSNLVNQAELLLVMNRRDESLASLRRAWDSNHHAVTVNAAFIAFHWSLLARLSNRDVTPGLARAKHLLESGYERAAGTFEALLATVRANGLPAEDLRFFSALAAAILDTSTAGRLAEFPRWREIKPIPLTAPWDLAL